MDEQVKDKIIELEKRLFLPDIRKSPEDLDRLLADEFIEIGSSGNRFTKAQIIENLNSESEIRITATEFKIKQIAPNAAMITYRAFIQNIGEAEERQSLRSSIWKFMDNRWQIIFHQGTPTRVS